MLKRSHRDVDLPSLVPPQFVSASEARRQAAASSGAEKTGSQVKSHGIRRQQSCKWDHALLSAYMVDAETPRAPTAGLGMGLEIWEPEWKSGWSSHSEYMKFLFGNTNQERNYTMSSGGIAASLRPTNNADIDQRNPSEDVFTADQEVTDTKDKEERARKRVRRDNVSSLEEGLNHQQNKIEGEAPIQRSVRFREPYDQDQGNKTERAESSRRQIREESTHQNEDSVPLDDDGELDADAMELIETDREITVGAKKFAAKTTLRRGFFARALKRQLEDLREENHRLKRIASHYLDDHERIELFSKLGTEHSQFLPLAASTQEPALVATTSPKTPSPEKAILSEIKDIKEAQAALENVVATTNRVVANPTDVDRRDLTLVKVVQQAQRAFVITNPALPDNPIVWASDEFAKLTGYSREEVCGRNCRFLQGPRTDPKSVQAVRRAIEEKHEASIVLLNYRKDGSTFWNRFFIAPLRDSTGRVTFYVGVQTDVSNALNEDDDNCDGIAAWAAQRYLHAGSNNLIRPSPALNAGSRPTSSETLNT